MSREKWKSPGNWCSAINCKNNRKEHGDIMSFFRFPKDAKRCKQWVINSRREDLLKPWPGETWEQSVQRMNKNNFLCGKHFEESQFMNVNTRNSLIFSAVPTIFNITNKPKPITPKREVPSRHPLNPKQKKQKHPLNIMESKPSKDDLGCRSGTELQHMAKQRGLKCSGNKNALINRLHENWFHTADEDKNFKEDSTSNSRCCCVPLCCMNSLLARKEGISMHRIPSESGRKLIREQWIRNLRNLCATLNLGENSRVCRKHFASDCFDEANQLKCDAVPTIFPSKPQALPERRENTLNQSNKSVKEEYESEVDDRTKDESVCESLENNDSYSNTKSDNECEQISFENSTATSSVSEKPYACDICGRRYKIHNKMKDHRLRHFRKCIPKGVHLHKHHMRSHAGEKPFECEVCKRRFTQVRMLNAHRRIHTNEKPYKCNMCDKAFKLKPSLTRHLETHNTEKVYPCFICGKFFAQTNSLKYHIRTHDSDVKWFECDLCPRKFRRNTSLKVHKRMHHRPDDALTCTICGKCFDDAGALEVHASQHAGENRKHECNVCQQRFFRLGDLTKHKIRKHNPADHLDSDAKERLYKCTFCGQRFSGQCALKIHRKKHNKRLESVIKHFSSANSNPENVATISSTYVVANDIVSEELTPKSNIVQPIVIEPDTPKILNIVIPIEQFNRIQNIYNEQKEANQNSHNDNSFNVNKNSSPVASCDLLQGPLPPMASNVSENRIGNLNQECPDANEIHNGLSIMEDNLVDSTTVKVENMEDNLIDSINVDIDNMEDNSIDSTNIKVETMESNSVDSINIKIETMESNSVDSTNIKVETMENNPVDSTNIKVETMEDSSIDMDANAGEHHLTTYSAIGTVKTELQSCGNYDSQDYHSIGQVSSLQMVQEVNHNENTCKIDKEVIKSWLARESKGRKSRKGIHPCNVCEKVLCSARALKTHIMLHTGDKPFKCNTCEKTFATKPHCERHEKTHSGEKPFQCDICNSRFTTAFSLKQHTLVHTGEKPYACLLCPKRFNSTSGLKFHMETHKDEKQHECEVCGKKLSNVTSLRRHKKTKHGINIKE